MRFSEAFRQTLFRYNLSGTEVAEASGITPSQISNFKNGSNLRIDTVERILDALPTEARLYMLNLVAQKSEPEQKPPALVGDYEADLKNASEG